MRLHLQSLQWTSVFFCLNIYMKPCLAGSCSSHAVQQMDILLFPSSQLEEINTWKKPWLTNGIQVRMLGRKMLLGTYSILRSCCPHTLNVSVQSPGGQRGGGKKKKALKCFTLKCSTLSVLLHVKSEELWANVKAEDFLSVLCVKKQLFCTGKLQSNVLYQCTSDVEKEGACLHTTLAKQCLEP